MSNKNPCRTNATKGMVKAGEIFGGHPQVSDDLTPSERVQMTIMFDRLNLLNAQLREVDLATRELIRSIVTARGKNPEKFGVNLAAGKILPVQPIVAPSDGDDLKGKGDLKDELEKEVKKVG